MKILVCVKQVYDSPETLAFNVFSGRVEYGPRTVFRMNRYDEYALEEALRIRERFAETVIDAVSVGPQRVEKTIRRALEVGADQGIHLQTKDDAYLSAFERAHHIASMALDRNYDLVLTGVMAEDDMESQVGQLLAGLLGYACATGVIYQQISEDSREITLERELERGRRECLTLPLPCVLTVQSGINTPRYPVLSHVLRARSAVLERMSVPPSNVSPTQQLVRILPPEESKKGIFLRGTAAQKAARLLDILHEHSLI